MQDPDGGSDRRGVMRSLGDPWLVVSTEVILQGEGTELRSLHNCFRMRPVGQCPTDRLRSQLTEPTG